jgi:hypothetical protein
MLDTRPRTIVRDEGQTRVAALVGTGERVAGRALGAAAGDFDVEAVEVELRPADRGHLHGRGVAVEREQLGSENVCSRLDVAGDAEGVCHSVHGRPFVGPGICVISIVYTTDISSLPVTAS